MKGSVPGSCAAILRTRGLMVNVTSTISSSVGSQSSAQRTHVYSACFTVLSVAPESRTPPQAGQRMFQDISKMPSRAPCRKAAITSSSLSLRSEEHTSELQSRLHLVCRLLLEKKKQH